MIFQDPKNGEEWLEVAKIRGRDAESLLKINGEEKSSIPLYISGYAVECALKAYLVVSGKSWSKGKEGHNLINLRERTGIPFSEINIGRGRRSYFLQTWTVDLRYQRDGIEFNFTFEELVQAAQRLRKFFDKKTKRKINNARRRGK